ncbi:MAG: 23S rRNA (adenine(2503)-C(2))-methyltransferase RlmN [Oscillatoriales cyanobacterium]|nr:MAG: 23S rRNA (adenine(2503)-C(2))-methyltransferase RlmN [Oscillatoriales cyanobacterium]
MAPVSIASNPQSDADILQSRPDRQPLPPLLGGSIAELTQWVKDQGQPAYRAKQLHQWIYERGARSLMDITVFPKTWREAAAEIPIGRSELHHRSESRDGTVKFLLKMTDGQIVETVGIPTRDRLTVCVSSQVGCAMGCDFCATGKGGFVRNLSRSEILDQVLTVQEDFDRRVSNVVFMGMGEPLHNPAAVLSAARSLNQDIGIGKRYITISTVGIPGRIRQLANERLQATLAVSLHAPNQALRESIVPSAASYPIEELIEDCRDYAAETGRRVTFEYILLAGVNDSYECMEELAELLHGFQAHVNLIPYNPIDEVDYKRPDPTRIRDFMQALDDRNVAVSIRRTRGLESDAACGQLRANLGKPTGRVGRFGGDRRR